jgi:transglutaminase-like putative cysteine protease
MVPSSEINKHSSITYRFDWVAVVLAGLVVFCAASSLAMAEWLPSLDLLTLTVIVAWALSSLIATRRWRSRTAHFVMILYGVFWVTLLGVHDMSDKVYGFTWMDSVRHLIVRLGEHIYLWLEAVSTGGVGKDNTIFLMVLVAGFWLITYVAVWNTIRQYHLWRAIAPAGVVLLINMYYYGGQQGLSFWLVVYLFAVLLYAARSYTLRQEQRWQFGRVHFKPEIERDFLQLGTIIAVAAIAFGMVAPAFAGAPQVSTLWREVSRPVRSIEDTFSRMFSGLQPHGLPYTNPFGRTLALLGQRNLGNELVMEVHSPEGRYWQGVIYDRYTGTAFQSSGTQRISASADELALPQDFQQRDLITQTVSIYFPNNTLIFAAPQPVEVNQTSWIDVLPGNDLSMWTTLTPLTTGDTYQVVSSVSRATIDQLRSAGANYPATIRERYLQLPDTLPQRVRDLAKKIVTDAKATNPYDQASALESWLRTNIKYNDQIPAPPQGQDGVDYVLFVTQQGFCDYYASAMAVMARSLGLPSRIATGYAQGQFDSKLNAYEVYQYNAHTWPEIYFPKYGWIQFEPTASQPEIVRPTANGTDPNAARHDRTPSDTPFELNPRERPNRAPEDIDTPVGGDTLQTLASARLTTVVIVVLIAAAVIALAIGSAWLGVRAYEGGGGARQVSTGGAWAFARLARMTRWLRLQLSAADTPYEQAKTIGLAVPKRQGEIDQLADLYVRERYGRADVDLNQTRSIWQHIHWSFWRAGAKRRLPRWLSAPRKWLKRLRR